MCLKRRFYSTLVYYRVKRGHCKLCIVCAFGVWMWFQGPWLSRVNSSLEMSADKYGDLVVIIRPVAGSVAFHWFVLQSCLASVVEGWVLSVALVLDSHTYCTAVTQMQNANNFFSKITK